MRVFLTSLPHVHCRYGLAEQRLRGAFSGSLLHLVVARWRVTPLEGDRDFIAPFLSLTGFGICD